MRIMNLGKAEVGATNSGSPTELQSKLKLQSLERATSKLTHMMIGKPQVFASCWLEIPAPCLLDLSIGLLTMRKFTSPRLRDLKRE